MSAQVRLILGLVGIVASTFCWFVNSPVIATPQQIAAGDAAPVPDRGLCGPQPQADGEEKTPAVLTNSIGMKLVLINPGKFMMGAPTTEMGRRDDEHLHAVEIARPFLIGKFEVTQAEYRAIMGTNPSQLKGDRLPVDMVSWLEALEFCGRLSRKEDLDYSLPTEAEWEYVCRAGTTTPYHFGQTLALSQANFHVVVFEQGKPKNHPDSRNRPVEVGSLPANAWGVHEMHGNVRELCGDFLDAKYYGNSPLRDPQGPAEGTMHVIRGGSWADEVLKCRSAMRGGVDVNAKVGAVGFRVVLRLRPDRPARKAPPDNVEPPSAKEFVNAVGMKLVRIEPGKFSMGMFRDKMSRIEDAQEHQVAIGKPFYIGKFEVTQAEYQAVMRVNPSRFRGERLPVDMVSWHDAAEFCKTLSQLEGRKYALPTEAEWEYCCRAGTTTYFYFGEEISSDQANFDEPSRGKTKAGIVIPGKVRNRTTPVGSFQANRWGLHDMHGNVLEWCADWYDKDYYKVSPNADPQGPETGSKRCMRGGGWRAGAFTQRSGLRLSANPDFRSPETGFRVVLR